MTRRHLVWKLFTLGVGLLPGVTNGSDAVDYDREVKPLLAKHCVSCHGATKPRGALRLDTAANALKGGKSGPSFVPGRAEESLLIESVTSTEAGERMPLKRPALSDVQIETLRRWIDQGAHAPSDETPSPGAPVHWAFVSPVRPVLPIDSHPIDALIHSRLTRDSLSPSPDADRATLIRRVSFDLTGLPPRWSDVVAFQTDDRPDAYERLVDRLLATPAYGERWARHWLDLARYADSNGYSIDAPRTIWKYRNWVIDALNRDQPFDEFLTDQLAGDLRPAATLNQRVATGFHRNTMINQEGSIDVEQFRIEAVVDRVATTATTFMGLTLACAQCHDHKYDPLSQREYYQFFAFFNSVDEPEIEFATSEEKEQRERIREEILGFHVTLKKEHPEIATKERAWESTLVLADTQGLPAELKDAFDRAIDKRTDRQWRGLTELFLSKSAEYRTEFASLSAIRAREPRFDTSMIVNERKTPRPTNIHLNGDFTRKGELVEPGVPQILPPLKPRNGSRADRLDLARWLVDPGHPLTARVTVNRIWQEYFGRGLVETENDFGTQGALPTHPELLDWLATEFISQGWSQKALHRLIVTSKTYRQSSHARPDLERMDPDNRLLARQTRLRLDAEVIRDAALSVSGLLSAKLGGPGVFPPQPDGVMTLGQMRRPWTVSTGNDRYRRGLYTFFWRATPNPSLTVFDAPNGIQTCTRRIRSNTPLQALTLLNDRAFVECAEAFSERICREPSMDDASRIALAFRLALGRSPTQPETKSLVELVQEEASTGRKTAWMTVARVILNLDEFITRE